jgi:hypothetical protein
MEGVHSYMRQPEFVYALNVLARTRGNVGLNDYVNPQDVRDMCYLVVYGVRLAVEPHLCLESLYVMSGAII